MINWRIWFAIKVLRSRGGYIKIGFGNKEGFSIYKTAITKKPE